MTTAPLSTSASSPPKRFRPSRVAALAAAISAGTILTVVFLPTGGRDIIVNPSFEYTSPPTYSCNYTETNGTYGAGYATTVAVAPGGEFNVSWQLACEP